MPDDQNKKKGRGPFKNAFIWAPTAVGGALTGMKGWRQVRDLAKTGRLWSPSAVREQIVTATSDLAARTVEYSRTVPASTTEAIRQQISQLGQAELLRVPSPQEVVRLSLRGALGRGAAGLAAEQAAMVVEQAMASPDALSAAMITAERRGVLPTFHANLTRLSKYAMGGGGLGGPLAPEVLAAARPYGPLPYLARGPGYALQQAPMQFLMGLPQMPAQVQETLGRMPGSLAGRPLAQMHRFPLGKPGMTGAELTAAMRGAYEAGARPFMSPRQLAGGRTKLAAWSTIDWESFFPYGSLSPATTRFTQFAREFYQPPRGLERLEHTMLRGMSGGIVIPRGQHPIMTEAWRPMHEAGLRAPAMGTLFQMGEEAEIFERTGGLLHPRGGMAVVSEAMQPYLETMRTRSYMLGAEDVSPAVQAALRGEVVELATKEAEELLGYAPGTGKPIFAPRGVRQAITGAEVLNLQRGVGPEIPAIRLLVGEHHPAISGMKLFGQEAKLGIEFMPTSEFRRAVGKGTIDAIGEVNAIRMGDVLRKDRGALLRQMTSGLFGLSMQKMKKSTRGPQAVVDFLRNPVALQKELEHTARGAAAARQGNPFGMLAAMPGVAEMRLLQLAREAGLSPEQMGYLGGAMPYNRFTKNIWREIAKTAGLSEVEIGRIASTKTAYGFIQGFPGGYPYHLQRGSIEPRGLSTLMGQRWALPGGRNLAQMMAADIIARIPGRPGAISAYESILGSLRGQAPAGLPTKTLEQAYLGMRTTGSPFGKSPYIVNLPTQYGAFRGKQLFVPAAGALPGITPVVTETGSLVYPKGPHTMYGRFLRMAHRRPELAEAAATEFTKEAFSRYRGLMFGLSRGRGEGLLRGVPAGAVGVEARWVGTLAGAVGADVPHTGFLTKTTAEEMFRGQLAAAATEEAESFVKMQRRLFFKGEAVPGYMWRHPLIGEMGTQPLMYRLAKGVEGYGAFIPPRLADIDIPGIGAVRRDISPMLGMAADLDYDHLVTAFIGTAKEADAVKEALRPQGVFRQAYTRFAAETIALQEHAARMRPATAQLAGFERYAAAYRALTAPEKVVPPLSAALTRTKLAMAMYAPESLPAFMSVSEMIEQLPLAAKHYPGQIVPGAEFAEWFRKGNLQELTYAHRAYFGTALEAPTEVTMRMGREPVPIPVHIRPEEIYGSALKAVEAARGQGTWNYIRQFVTESQGKITTAQIHEFTEAVAKGTGGAATEQLTRMAMAKVGRGASLASAHLESISTSIKELGSVAKRSLGPLGIGIAASIGIAMLAGREGYTSTAGPGPQVAIPQQSRGGITPEEITPAVAGGGPTAPDGIITPEAYISNTPPLSYRVTASARTNRPPLPNQIGGAIRSILPDGRVNVHVRDFRQKLTPRELEEKIYGD